jgi:hypothetical protein
MFGKRPDGQRVRGLSKTRAIMPFVSSRRNDSLVLYETEIEVDEALRFVERENQHRPEDRPMTLFHLFLRSLARAFQERPGVNRFVAGYRLWARNHVAFTFSAKREMVDGSPMITVKRIFEPDETLDEMVDSILDGLRARRGGKKTGSDKEMDVVLRLPAWMTRIFIWLLHQANQLGALPRSVLDDDPLCTSCFVANLGSVNMEAGYHHLWEYGTCSIFVMLGAIHERADGKRVMVTKYTYDERIEDGLYGGLTMEAIKDGVENPEGLR